MPVDRQARARRRSPGPRRPVAEALEPRRLLATIVVNSTGDAEGADGGRTISLRQAIEISDGSLPPSSLTTDQARQVVGELVTPNTIHFAVPGVGPFTIAPASELPAITRPAIIDGYSQPGAHPNTNRPRLADNATILITLDGSRLPLGSTGLDIKAGASTVRGLAIGGFATSGELNFNHISGDGIGILVEGLGRDLIQGNFLGTDATGTRPMPNGSGVQVVGLTSLFGDFITIGGAVAASRNVISANQDGGLLISASRSQVQGNFIGTDASGSRALPNRVGIRSLGGGPNTIGGTASGAGNLISGNTLSGLSLGGLYAVEGNLIGTDVTGTAPVPNGTGIEDGIGGSTIGGTASGAGNLISGNQVGLSYYAARGRFEGNFIGTDLAGTRALPNTRAGLLVAGDSATIGGTASGAGNLISGNAGTGLVVQGSAAMVQGNQIGTDASGTRPLGNGIGIEAKGPAATIGGTSAGAGNVISANGTGLAIKGSRVAALGNRIGTDATGTRPLGNLGDGVDVSGGSDTIGGTASGAGNVIAYNQGDGVLVLVEFFYFQNFDPGTFPGDFFYHNTGGGQANTISANSIFGNGGAGIHLLDNLASFLKSLGPGYLPNYASALSPGDPPGGNGLLAAPTIESATPFGAGTAIAGGLEAAPSATFTVELFAEPDGPGRAQAYLGSALATADASGHASFALRTGLDLSGRSLTATATDSGGDTSGFALDVTAYSTTTRLSSPAGPLVAGQPLALVASVLEARGGGMPTGLIAFLRDGLVIGSAPLDSSGSATLNIVAPDGSHAYTAAFAGSPGNPGSTSSPVVVTADRRATAISLAGPGLVAAFGQVLTFTAIVAPTPLGVPTGSVAFAADGVLIGVVPLDASGVARLATAGLAVGPHSLQASYLGDPLDAPSLSGELRQDVLPSVALGGPLVLSVEAPSTRSIRITFDRPLRPATARDRANYRVVGPDGRAIAVTSAFFNPVDNSVTLTTRGPLRYRVTYRVRVDGLRPGRVADSSGVPLDGKHLGRPGSSFLGRVTLARPHPSGPKAPARGRKPG